jgi:hypothetical protein
MEGWIARARTESKRWRRKRRRWVLEVLKKGKTILDMVAELGVNEKTVYRYLKTPGVQARIKEYLRELAKRLKQEDEERRKSWRARHANIYQFNHQHFFFHKKKADSILALHSIIT